MTDVLGCDKRRFITGFIAAFYALLVSLAILVLLLGSFSRNETLEGRLLPTGGLLEVVPQRAGTVARTFVHDGDEVTKGQPLMEISLDQRARDGQAIRSLYESSDALRGASIRNQSEADAAELAGQESLLLQSRTYLSDKQKNLAEQRQIAVDRVGYAQDRVNRSSLLFAQGLVSAVQMDILLDTAAAQMAAVQAIDGQQIELAKQESQLEADIQNLRVRHLQARSAALAASAGAISAHANNLAQDGLVVVAQQTGRATLFVRAGEPVSPSSPVASIVPANSRLEAQLLVPSKALGFMQIGDPVKLMYDSFPYQMFGTAGGRVVRISRAPTATTSASNEDPGPRFSVFVALSQQEVKAYGQRWPLIAGTSLKAVVTLERHSVFEWLLQPFRTLQANAMS